MIRRIKTTGKHVTEVGTEIVITSQKRAGVALTYQEFSLVMDPTSAEALGRRLCLDAREARKAVA